MYHMSERDYTLYDIPLLYTGTIYFESSGASYWLISGLWRKRQLITGKPSYQVRYPTGDRICFAFEEMFEALNDQEKEIILWNIDLWNLSSVEYLERDYPVK